MKNFNFALLVIFLFSGNFASFSQSAVLPKPNPGLLFSLNYGRNYSEISQNQGNSFTLKFQIPISKHFGIAAGMLANKNNAPDSYSETEKYFSFFNNLDLAFSIGKKHRLVAATGVSHQFLPAIENRYYQDCFCGVGYSSFSKPISSYYFRQSEYGNSYHFFGVNAMLDYQFFFSKKYFAAAGFDWHFFKNKKLEENFGRREVSMRQLRLGIGLKI